MKTKPYPQFIFAIFFFMATNLQAQEGVIGYSDHTKAPVVKSERELTASFAVNLYNITAQPNNEDFGQPKALNFGKTDDTPPHLNVSITNCQLPGTHLWYSCGEICVFTVESNEEWEFISDSDWLTICELSVEDGYYDIIPASSNYSFESKWGMITIETASGLQHDIVIEQLPGPYIETDPEMVVLDASGEQVTFTIYHNYGFRIMYPEVDWLYFDHDIDHTEFDGFRGTNITIWADENHASFSRTTTLGIFSTGELFYYLLDVEQLGITSQITLNPMMLEFGNVEIGNCQDLSFTINGTGLDLDNGVEFSIPDGFKAGTSINYAHEDYFTIPFTSIGFGETIMVQFCPTEAKEYSENITVSSAELTEYVSLTGKGLEPEIGKDFAVKHLFTDNFNYHIADQIKVTARIDNFGSKAQNNVPVRFRLYDSGNDVLHELEQNVSLQAGDTLTIIKYLWAPLGSSNGTYTVEVQTLLPGDQNPDNDYQRRTVYMGDALPYIQYYNTTTDSIEGLGSSLDILGYNVKLELLYNSYNGSPAAKITVTKENRQETSICLMDRLAFFDNGDFVVNPVYIEAGNQTIIYEVFIPSDDLMIVPHKLITGQDSKGFYAITAPHIPSEISARFTEDASVVDNWLSMSISGDNSFYAEVSLPPMTEERLYDFWLRTNNGYIHFLELEVESSQPQIPSVNTVEISEITYFSATSGGNVINDGGAEVTARGVVWSTDPNPTIENNLGVTNDGCGTGEFESQITSLDAFQTYYVRAYATNIEGTGYGNVISFKTQGICEIIAIAGSGGKISPSYNVFVICGDSQTFNITADECYHIMDVLIDGQSVGPVTSYTFEDVNDNHTIHAVFSAFLIPEVETMPITEITTSSAISGGLIEDDGSEIFARGMVWGISENPSIENHLGITYDGEDAGSYISNLSGLDPGNTHFVRAYATNCAGTGYGQEVSFLTLDSEVSLCEALDNCDLIFTTGGHANWYGQIYESHDGIDAARSGTISHNQKTWVETIIEGPGELSFWWKISSKQISDYLRFYINGIEKLKISGEVDWQNVHYFFDAGTFTIKWAYTKDAYISEGMDCAWLDQVDFDDNETSIARNELSKVNLFPNPFQNTITIEKAENYHRVIMSNLVGQTFLEQTLSGSEIETISTQGLPKGIYLVTLIDKQGMRMVRKMIKE